MLHQVDWKLKMQDPASLPVCLSIHLSSAARKLLHRIPSNVSNLMVQSSPVPIRLARLSGQNIPLLNTLVNNNVSGKLKSRFSRKLPVDIHSCLRIRPNAFGCPLPLSLLLLSGLKFHRYTGNIKISWADGHEIYWELSCSTEDEPMSILYSTRAFLWHHCRQGVL